jgi:homogentisate phytyltransferase/homogentisate geranylgeranyltransferase
MNGSLLSLNGNLYTFWKFSRPHTIIGTTLSVWGLYAIAIALTGSSIAPENLFYASLTWLACLCGNIYIVGLNQLEDIEIDRINKPHLPIASGEFTINRGRAIVAITGVSAIAIALLQGPWLFATVGISIALGTAYSLPPIRLKRFPFWASFCIYTVRGIIVNLGLFLHHHWLLTHPENLTGEVFDIPLAVWALTLFILIFTFAIAIFKDIPDIEGDKQYNITTFTIRLGAPAVFNLARWTITVAYFAILLGGFFLFISVNPIFLIASHLFALGLLWWRTQKVDLKERSQIASCYQFIWKLFFLEYLIFPAACWF